MALPTITYSDEATDAWLALIDRMAGFGAHATLTLSTGGSVYVELASSGYSDEDGMAAIRYYLLDEEGERISGLPLQQLDSELITDIHIH